MPLFTLILAALAIHAQAADLPTVEQLTSIAERFQNAAKATGLDLDKPLPRVFIRNHPGLSVYHPKENEITFPDWHALTEQARAPWVETGKSLAEPMSGERYFGEIFRYFFAHEVCHWVQMQRLRIDSVSQIDDPYAFEYQANQCATAFWAETEPGWLQALAGKMAEVVAKRKEAAPWGADVRAWFNPRYPRINTDEYGLVQFRMVLDTWKATPRVTFAGVMAQMTLDGIRRFYNTRYREGLRAEFQLKEASPLLVESIRGRKPGAALDLGLGEGRNSLFMAAEQWRVTGVDLSGVGVENARKAAVARGLTLNLVESDLDLYDLGETRWDLITSFYMQDWHYNSKTDTFARIARSMRPGGLFVLEGFGPPRLRQEAIEKAFSGWRILRSETIEAEPEWGRGRKREIIRFVAEKP